MDVYRIKKIIANCLGVGILKQEALLRQALKEEGLNYRNFTIDIDHVNGTNHVNGFTFPIIYPISFFKKSERLHSSKKKYKFYFNGNMSSAGGRQDSLRPFDKRNSRIIESNEGRSRYRRKSYYNKKYFLGLADAEFGLCPHQKDFVGNRDTMWTYRFIECCMTKTMPVVFNDSPLGKDFCSDFDLITDEEALNNDVIYDPNLADNNFKKCLAKFSLTESYLNKIKSSI